MGVNSWSILQLRIQERLQFCESEVPTRIMGPISSYKNQLAHRIWKLKLLWKRLGSTIVNLTPPNGHTIDFASAKAIKKCIKLCVSYEMVA